jgi:hypothetical protein
MRSQRRFVVLIVALAVLGGCAPKVPLRLSMREASVDIDGVKPPTVVVPGARVAPVRPQLPLPTVPAPLDLPPPAPLCPKADQFAVPALVADPAILALPAPATYVFREDGDFATGGAIPIEGDYPPIGQRTVVLGSKAKGYDFAVAERVGASTKTTAFMLVQPSGSIAAQQGGLYLSAMQWDDPILGKGVFRPLLPMQFLPLPITPGQSVTSTGFDPEHGVSMTLRGGVGAEKKRVDACGSLIDAWELNLTQVIVTPEGELNITATYAIATQYGGLSVSDVISVTGIRASALAATPSSTLRSVISQLPKETGPHG